MWCAPLAKRRHEHDGRRVAANSSTGGRCAACHGCFSILNLRLLGSFASYQSQLPCPWVGGVERQERSRIKWLQRSWSVERYKQLCLHVPSLVQTRPRFVGQDSVLGKGSVACLYFHGGVQPAPPIWQEWMGIFDSSVIRLAGE